MSTTRDTIQISLGPSANAVTAHLLNLQGLAVTPSSEEDHACDPPTTHAVEQSFWVPRAILVDEATRFPAMEEPRADSSLVSTWGERVEIFDSAWSHPAPQMANFFETASILAYNSHSRYYQEPQQRDNYKTSSSNSRHVVWDDDEEEDKEDPQDRAQRQQRERGVWQSQTQAPLQEKLSQMWNETEEPALAWTDYLMPPYSQKSKVALPYSHQSKMVSHWDQFQSTKELDTWREDVLSERLRHLLEDCDYCQGFTITTEGHGIYAGLASSLLQEMQEECKSAGRIVFHVTNPQGTEDATAPNENESEDPAASNSSWQPENVQRVRKHVQSGLALHDFTQNAHVVVPLRLEGDNLFRSSARIAMALESATLPFRLRSIVDPRYKIGLQNAPFFGQGGDDTRWGTTAQRLSFGEYISCLKPSSQYSILELDATSSSSADLFEQFKQGTSVERDQRMRDDGRDARRNRPREVSPGGWLLDEKHGGLLSSCSWEGATDRSVHHHFSLATALRPSPMFQDEYGTGMSQYLTCMVEGMGIRYRPERSMCTVLNQSLSHLTRGGYGAGAYWESLHHEAPVLAVLGNTTRAYPYLNQVATDMKLIFGLRHRGYINRDVLSGVLPETEDCEEALAGCFDIRDSYHPPEASGLVQDEGGGYEDF